MDNFDNIKSILTFDNQDLFYFIQILQRKKDVPELTCSCKKIRSFYVHSIEDLDKCKDKIIDECNRNKARAYIDVNVKHVKKVALLALKKIAELIYEEHYEAVKNVYEYACGNVAAYGKKLWVIDVDTKDDSTLEIVKRKLEEFVVDIKIMLETKHGFHFITDTFALNKFGNIENVEVKKHGHTILYIPENIMESIHPGSHVYLGSPTFVC